MTTELRPREVRLAETFVELADTLVDDYDVIDLLDLLVTRCVTLLDAAAAGLMLADPGGRLHTVAASDERAHIVELFELQNHEGPCLEAFRTGKAVVNDDLQAAMDRWPRFAAAARAQGFASVQALPLRLRDQTVGALNLFHAHPTSGGSTDLQIAQALADVAAIGLLQARAIHRESLVAEQLAGALNSRIIIEQAKGVTAERQGVETAVAFGLLRDHARVHGIKLSDYARAVVEGTEKAPEATPTS